MLGRGLIAIALMAATLTPAVAEQAPPIPKDVAVLTTEQLKTMLDRKHKFLLVDARNASEYKEAYIPGAIHVYDKEMEAHRAKFPAEKSHPIVFYCNGYPKCLRSLNGAKTALGWGYTKVSVYAAGIPEWIDKGYPIERR
jgi:rhodanese-related sulfurtransferase